MQTIPDSMEILRTPSLEDQLIAGVSPEIIEILGQEEVIKLEALSHDLTWISGVVEAENPFAKERTGEPDLSFIKPKQIARILEVYEAGTDLTAEKVRDSQSINPVRSIGSLLSFLRLKNLGDEAQVALYRHIEAVGDAASEVSSPGLESIAEGDERMPVEQVVELSNQMNLLREYAEQLPMDGTFEAIKSVLIMARKMISAKTRHIEAGPASVRTYESFSKQSKAVDRILAKLDKTRVYHKATLKDCADLYETLKAGVIVQKVMFALDLLNAAADTKALLEETNGGLDETRAGLVLNAEKYVVVKIAEAEKALRDVDPQIVTNRAAQRELQRLKSPNLSQAERERVARQEEEVSRDLNLRVTMARDILRGGERLKAKNGDNPKEITEKLKRFFEDVNFTDTERRQHEVSGLIVAMSTGKFDEFIRTLAELKSEDVTEAVGIVTRDRRSIITELQDFDIDSRMETIRFLISNPRNTHAVATALSTAQFAKLELAVAKYFEAHSLSPEPTK